MSLSLRRPSAILVVDANIILGVALGKRSRPTLDLVSDRRLLVTSSRVRAELSGVVAGIERFKRARENVLQVLRVVSIADEGDYVGRLEEAAEVLRVAVASRNGRTAAAHVLALAWAVDADIWSHDRDVAGTGWPSWSSANLRAALADA